jgi:glycine/D-amino acid oxidase-like deaminating enzyme
VTPLPTAPGSYWLDRTPRPRRPALDVDLDADVAVVGGGIAGAFTAMLAAREPADVVALEADALGRGATGRNAGFLLQDAAETYAEAVATFGEAAASGLRSIGARTRSLVREVAEHGDVGLRFGGSLRLAEDGTEAAWFRRSAESTGRHLDRDGLPEAYRGRGFAAGYEIDEDGEVHPLRLLDLVVRRAEESGARFFEGSPVESLVERGGRVELRTPRAVVRARHAIVATNAWISRLMGGRPWVRPVRAQMLAARVFPRPRWDRPVYANRGREYWRLLDDGTVLLGGMRRKGGDIEETDDARPAAPVQPALDAYLAGILPPRTHVEVVARWAGTMGFTADGLPVVGRAPERERTFVVGGFNGHGMGWGAGFALAVLEQAGNGDEAGGGVFDPSRPALLAPDREESG